MLTEVRLSQEHCRLMLAIGDAIKEHTGKSPMTVEAIVGCLAFCAGSAIIHGTKDTRVRRQLREIAIGNVDQGMEAMRHALSGSKLIIPDMVM